MCRLSTVARSRCFRKQKNSHGLNASKSHRTPPPRQNTEHPTTHMCYTNTFTVLLIICNVTLLGGSFSLSQQHRGGKKYLMLLPALPACPSKRLRSNTFSPTHECKKSHHKTTTINPHETKEWQKLNKPPIEMKTNTQKKKLHGYPQQALDKKHTSIQTWGVYRVLRSIHSSTTLKIVVAPFLSVYTSSTNIATTKRCCGLPI